MRAAGRFLAILTGTFVVLGCVTSVDRVSLRANKDPSFSETLDRLYVVVDTKGSRIGQVPLDDYLRASIERRFSALGVQTRAAAPEGLELDDGAIRRDAAEFGARYSMTIRREGEQVDVRTGGYVGPGGYWVPTSSTQITYFFDTAVWDASKEARIWRSRIEVKGQLKAASADELIDELITALHADGLIAFEQGAFQPVASKKELDVGMTFLAVGLVAGLLPLIWVYFLLF